MDGEYPKDQSGERQTAASSSGEVSGTHMQPAGSPANAAITTSGGQSFLPEATQQMLQELIDLPGQILPAETVHHLKNAGRETLLAVYSLWQNINRASQGASGEKVRKHIEVE